MRKFHFTGSKSKSKFYQPCRVLGGKSGLNTVSDPYILSFMACTRYENIIGSESYFVYNLVQTLIFF